MNNGELYAKRILALEKEIRELKTAHYKTATTISTMESTSTINFSLGLFGDQMWQEVWSTKRAIITLTTEGGEDMISACYLVGVTPNNLNMRYVYLRRIDSNPGQVKYEALVYSQNYDDYDTLSGGGSVNLSYTIKAIGSSKFSISIQYKNLEGGS